MGVIPRLSQIHYYGDDALGVSHERISNSTQYGRYRQYHDLQQANSTVFACAQVLEGLGPFRRW